MYIDIFFHNCCPLFLSIHKYMYEYTKNNKYMYVFLISTFCVFFVFAVFWEKYFFLLFWGLFCVFIFFIFFKKYFHFFSGELKYVRVGDKQSKIQKTMQEINFFFSRIKMSFVNTMNNVRRSLCKLRL